MLGIDPLSDAMLKESILLYQYLGSINGIEGPLDVRLHVNPTPIIQWKFSSTNGLVGNLQNPTDVIGIDFRIPEQYVNVKGFAQSAGTLIYEYEQGAYFAEQGTYPEAITDLKVIVPNAKFHEIHLTGEKNISSRDFVEGLDGTEKSVGTRRNIGKRIEIDLDSNWSVVIFTPQEGLDWLRNQNFTNVGSLLTTTLYVRYEDEASPIGLPIEAFEEKLRHILLLLSFANGGFIDYLMSECHSENEGGTNGFWRYHARHQVAPIDQLGGSWFCLKSDLDSYLKCCPALEKMMKFEIWSATLPSIFIWYFQAVQRERGYLKSWQVTANAIGAALERLCDTLVEETPTIKADYLTSNGISSKQFYFRDLIKAVLDHIGLRNIDRYHLDKEVDSFIDVRNDATHSRQTTKFKPHRRYQQIFMAVQWLEEILLWRLGYYGEHKIQTAPGMQSGPVKYNLLARDSSW